jgi:hypothetical protein
MTLISLQLFYSNSLYQKAKLFFIWYPIFPQSAIPDLEEKASSRTGVDAVYIQRNVFKSFTAEGTKDVRQLKPTTKRC